MTFGAARQFDTSRILSSHLSTSAAAASTSQKRTGMAASFDYDFAVIGGGSGGMAAAKEAAKLGANVVCFDYVKPSPQGTRWGLGGTCVNVGCVPKKLMHYAGILGAGMHDAHELGLKVPVGEDGHSHVKHDWGQLVGTVQNHVHSLNFSYRVGLRSAKVNYVNALAKFADPHTIAYTEKGVDKTLTAKYILIAVGGRPQIPDDVPGAREYAITSDDVFSMTNEPGRVLCVGGSYISLECAGFFTELGYDTSVAVRSIFLRGFDQQCADKVGRVGHGRPRNEVPARNHPQRHPEARGRALGGLVQEGGGRRGGTQPGLRHGAVRHRSYPRRQGPEPRCGRRQDAEEREDPRGGRAHERGAHLRRRRRHPDPAGAHAGGDQGWGDARPAALCRLYPGPGLPPRTHRRLHPRRVRLRGVQRGGGRAPLRQAERRDVPLRVHDAGVRGDAPQEGEIGHRRRAGRRHAAHVPREARLPEGERRRARDWLPLRRPERGGGDAGLRPRPQARGHQEGLRQPGGDPPDGRGGLLRPLDHAVLGRGLPRLGRLRRRQVRLNILELALEKGRGGPAAEPFLKLFDLISINEISKGCLHRSTNVHFTYAIET